MESLEVFSHNDIGAETFLALNCHSETLIELKLSNIKPEAMLSLSLLKGCTSLTSLLLTETTGTTDLENTQNDIFLELVAWLRNCKHIQSITFRTFMSAPAILTPVLLENDIHLTELELDEYNGLIARDFHLALAHQRSLRTIRLKGEAEDFTKDDLDALVDSLSKLTNLTELRLREISDYFRDEHICRISRSLTQLEDFYTTGWGISDAIWPDMLSLKSLRRFEISALTTFTADGILGFISNLSQGNLGLIFSVMMADPESGLSEEGQSTIRDSLAAKVEGRFDYMLARGTKHPKTKLYETLLTKTRSRCL